MDEEKIKAQESQLEGERNAALKKIKNLSSDSDSFKGKVSLAKILGGDILTANMIRKQMGVIILIVALLIIYISNQYIREQEINKIDKLKTALADAKYRALTTSSYLTEQSRLSKIIELLKENNDTTFTKENTPPYIILIP